MPSARVETDNPVDFDHRDAGVLPRPAGMGVSLLFAPSSRPSVMDIERLLASDECGAPTARISHQPAADQGWLELLASGLTFDVTGLAPAVAETPKLSRHFYGFEGKPELDALEAIDLVPSGHIAGGGMMPPIVRTLVGMAAALSLQMPVSAVQWHSAGTVMEPDYFARVVMNWLSGGAFPTLGLAALVEADAGGIGSQGLAAFCGQEFQLEPAHGEPHADTVKLALRVADHLVRRGPVTAPSLIEGTRLLAEPSQVGKSVWVWRQD